MQEAVTYCGNINANANAQLQTQMQNTTVAIKFTCLRFCSFWLVVFILRIFRSWLIVFGFARAVQRETRCADHIRCSKHRKGQNCRVEKEHHSKKDKERLLEIHFAYVYAFNNGTNIRFCYLKSQAVCKIRLFWGKFGRFWGKVGLWGFT